MCDSPDDLVALVSAHPSQSWLYRGLIKRLREELAKLQVEVNEEKSRNVELTNGESFAFLGFEIRRIRTRAGKWRPHSMPSRKARKALLAKLKVEFQSRESQPVSRVIDKINPILRGWVTYFAVGHSSRCFSYVRDWVEKKVRRQMLKARKRPGFGWKRWSKGLIYGELGLFDGYKLRPRQSSPKALPAR
ncbi:MAG: DNA polymerase [Cyanobacteria bacterium NC_groundwater_1444_Ag_S-0.65um_54_12]|nr:DNA polymerase [Cyanobacteria bacterium NC_groundwater_1444_Ag_S-0.65um_54_12]